MTIQITSALEHQLAEAAEANACSPDEIAEEAIQVYLAEQAEHRAAIERARADVAAGRVLSSAEVWARLESLFQR